MSDREPPNHREGEREGGRDGGTEGEIEDPRSCLEAPLLLLRDCGQGREKAHPRAPSVLLPPKTPAEVL